MKLMSTALALVLVGGTAFVSVVPGLAEASPSCTPEVLEDGSVLYAQVFAAKPVRKKPPHIKALLPKQTLGAKLYLHADKGMTKQYLRRAAACHMKADTPAYEHDPLRVEGTTSLWVYQAGGGFVIKLTGKDQKVGKEIWRRAQTVTTEVDSGTADKKDSTDL